MEVVGCSVEVIPMDADAQGKPFCSRNNFAPAIISTALSTLSSTPLHTTLQAMRLAYCRYIQLECSTTKRGWGDAKLQAIRLNVTGDCVGRWCIY